MLEKLRIVFLDMILKLKESGFDMTIGTKMKIQFLCRLMVGYENLSSKEKRRKIFEEMLIKNAKELEDDLLDELIRLIEKNDYFISENYSDYLTSLLTNNIVTAKSSPSI